jgi:hypothetical protein
MTTEEFKEKRAEIRRGEWTKANEQNNAAPAENETDTETEPEPTMYVGMTFSGPPLFGPLRSTSLAEHLNTMAKSGATQKEVEAEARKITPVCYMMHEAPSPSKVPKTPRPKPVMQSSEEEDDGITMFWVYACGSNGVPFPPGTPIRFATFLDVSMKNSLFRELMYTFPLEHGQWRVVKDGHVLKDDDTPRSLGMEDGDAVEVKLLMLNVQPKPSPPRDPRIPYNSNESDDDDGTAAAASATSTNHTSASAKEPKGKDTKDMSLEVWWGMRRFLTVEWGKHRLMHRLMAALAVVCPVQNCHIILRTMRQVTSGVGCVVDTDCPHSLSLKNGDMLVMQHLPSQQQITPHFIPSLAVAERILKISGLRIHTDFERVDRGSESVGSKEGYVKSTNITLNNKSTSINTESERTLIKFSQKTSKNKRKSHTPIREGEVKRRKSPLTSPYMRRNRNSSKSHRITRVTEPFIDNLGFKTTKNPNSDTCDHENSGFPSIRLVRIRNPPYRSRRPNIDFGNIVENYVKNRENPNFGKNTPKSESQSKSQNDNSSSDSESEDLLMSQKQVITNLAPNRGSYDHIGSAYVIRRKYAPGKKVYTPDMRFPFRHSENSGPVSSRNLPDHVTVDESITKNTSSQERTSHG